MGLVEQSSIGMIRFDCRPDGWEVSINVNPAERGKGLGGALLQNGISHFKALHPAAKLTATVRPDTEASRRIFTACGFQWVDRRDEHDHFEAL